MGAVAGHGLRAIIQVTHSDVLIYTGWSKNIPFVKLSYIDRFIKSFYWHTRYRYSKSLTPRTVLWPAEN